MAAVVAKVTIRKAVAKVADRDRLCLLEEFMVLGVDTMAAVRTV